MLAIQKQKAWWCKTNTVPILLKAKAGWTAMQKMLKQNVGMVIIYENMSGPATRGFFTDHCMWRMKNNFDKLVLQPALYLYIDTNNKYIKLFSRWSENWVSANIWHNNLCIKEE